jgi:hypothetical protein
MDLPSAFNHPTGHVGRTSGFQSQRARAGSATSQTEHGGQQEPLASLLASLACQRPVAYNANLARIAGDAKAGLMLSQLLYWTRVGVSIEASEGWILKSRDQWALETGLSRHEQESARCILLGAGLIDETLSGSPARLAYRVRLDKVSRALSQMLRSEPVQWSLFDVRSNAAQVRALLGANLAFYRVYTQVTQSITAAVFMSRALTTQKALINGKHSDWFAFGSTEWMAQTGLTAAQLRSSKQKLCQLGILEQAVMEYPRKRSFIRIKLQELTARLLDLGVINLGFLAADESKVKNRSDESPDRNHHELVAASSNGSDKLSNRFTVKRLDILSDGLSELLDRKDQGPESASSAKSCHQDGGFSVSPNGSDKLANCFTVKRLDILSDGLSKLLDRNDREPESTSSAKSCHQDGGFSQVKSHQTPQKDLIYMSKPANKLAGFSTSDGEFSHHQRRVLAPLHARARPLTTYKTTPPPKSPIAKTTDPPQHSNAGGAGGGGGISEFFEALIWPGRDAPGFDDADADLRAIKAMLKDHPIKKSITADRLQLILDEVASAVRSGKVRNVVIYTSSLLNKEMAGTLVLSAAYQWQQQRAQRGKGTTAAAQLSTLSISKAWPQRPLTQKAPADPLAQALWAVVLEQLQRYVPPSQIGTWLKPMQVALDLPAKRLLLCASRFKVEHIKAAYLSTIERVLVQVIAVQPELAVAQSVQLLTSLPQPNLQPTQGKTAP